MVLRIHRGVEAMNGYKYCKAPLGEIVNFNAKQTHLSLKLMGGRVVSGYGTSTAELSCTYVRHSHFTTS